MYYVTLTVVYVHQKHTNRHTRNTVFMKNEKKMIKENFEYNLNIITFTYIVFNVLIEINSNNKRENENKKANRQTYKEKKTTQRIYE